MLVDIVAATILIEMTVQIAAGGGGGGGGGNSADIFP